MFLLIDKPKGITSHDVVDEIRKITGERKVGHAGTLDPNATGLLLLAIGGESTKKLSGFLGLKKEYLAVIHLGEVRDTDDSEGSIVNVDLDNNLIPDKDFVDKVLEGFKGEQLQTPPIYSAIKIHGKKAYELARKGKKVKLKPRKIVVYSIKLISYRYPLLKIGFLVSGGTYIRALARDIGKKLGCGAYLEDLRRTRIGDFSISDSVKLGELNKDNWKEYLLKDGE